MLSNKEKIELAKTQHYNWLKKLGLNVDMDTGHIIKSTDYGSDELDLSYLKVRNSIPTSDRIPGACVKRTLPKAQLPAGKTIGIGYNKGTYQVVDQSDFKTMGRKV